MTDATITVRVSTDLKRAYEEAANEADTGVTQSDLIREQLAAGIEDGTLEIPDEFQTLAERSRVVDRNKVNQLRGGFRARVVRQFRKRWEAGWRPDEVDLLLEGYREEAKVLFDEPDEQIQYIEDLLSEYREKWETSDYDPLEDPFGGYEGVEDAEKQHEHAERIRETAEKLVRERPAKSEHARRERARDLHRKEDMPLEAAEKAINEAVEKVYE